jgi:hypothetical protein
MSKVINICSCLRWNKSVYLGYHQEKICSTHTHKKKNMEDPCYVFSFVSCYIYCMTSPIPIHSYVGWIKFPYFESNIFHWMWLKGFFFYRLKEINFARRYDANRWRKYILFNFYISLNVIKSFFFLFRLDSILHFFILFNFYILNIVCENIIANIN